MLTSEARDFTFVEDGAKVATRYRTTEKNGVVLLDGFFSKNGSKSSFGPISVGSKPLVVEREEGADVTISGTLIDANGAPINSANKARLGNPLPAE